MVRVERKVFTTGVKIFGCDYMDEKLNPYINGKDKLIVRYNSEMSIEG